MRLAGSRVVSVGAKRSSMVTIRQVEAKVIAGRRKITGNECERKKAKAVKAMELHWDNSKLLTIRKHEMNRGKKRKEASLVGE